MASLRKKYEKIQTLYNNFKNTAITWFLKKQKEISEFIDRTVKSIGNLLNKTYSFFFELLNKEKIEVAKLENEVKQLGFSNVFYKGMSLKVAPPLNDCLKNIFTYYPKFKNQIKSIGEYTTLCKETETRVLQEKIKYHRKLNPNATDKEIIKIARTEMTKELSENKKKFGLSFEIYADINDLKGIYFNSQKYREAGKNFHPWGCNNIKGAIYHEISHQIDYMLKLSEDKEIKKMYDNWIKNIIDNLNEIGINKQKNKEGKMTNEKLEEKNKECQNNIDREKEKLSKEFCGSVLPGNNENEEDHAVNPYREFVAEALAEYFMFVESSSEIAIAVSKKMEELYTKIA